MPCVIFFFFHAIRHHNTEPEKEGSILPRCSLLSAPQRRQQIYHFPPSITPCFTSPTHTAEFCKCRVAEHLICHGELCVAQSWDSPGALQELQNTPASECAHSSCFGSPKEPASTAAGSAHAEGWLTLHGCKGHVCFCLCIASCPATCRDCATKSARGSAQAG